jgi:hypothetical protein
MWEVMAAQCLLALAGIWITVRFIRTDGGGAASHGP